MNDDYCVFVILAGLIALALPSDGLVIYVGFAGVLVVLAGLSGGIECGGTVTEPGESAPVVGPREF